MVKRILLFSFFIVCCSTMSFVFCQTPVTIKLENPSFEDEPQAGHAPTGWFDCGFAGESPPDVNPTNRFKIRTDAYHGRTYLGMVTRDNNTWESVGQVLTTPLLKDISYTFSIYLARSDMYMSQSRKNGANVNYVTPAILRIWAGSLECSKQELLVKTEPIISTKWQKYDFTFTPKSDYQCFMMEAFCASSPENGNILLDKASNMIPQKDK